MCFCCLLVCFGLKTLALWWNEFGIDSVETWTLIMPL